MGSDADRVRNEAISPYLKRAAIVSSRPSNYTSRDLPRELARRTPAHEQEQPDIM